MPRPELPSTITTAASSRSGWIAGEALASAILIALAGPAAGQAQKPYIIPQPPSGVGGSLGWNMAESVHVCQSFAYAMSPLVIGHVEWIDAASLIDGTVAFEARVNRDMSINWTGLFFTIRADQGFARFTCHFNVSAAEDDAETRARFDVLAQHLRTTAPALAMINQRDDGTIRLSLCQVIETRFRETSMILQTLDTRLVDTTLEATHTAEVDPELPCRAR